MLSHNKSASFNQSKTQRIAMASLLAALALIFSYVEAVIPVPVAIPGIKLGIANLAVLIALYRFDFKHAMSINVIRIIVSGLLFNGIFGALYALSGGILSLSVMWILKKADLFSMVGVSMAGGVAHNIGQILVASVIVSDLRMFMYLPVLMFSGIISGIIIGILAYYVQRALRIDKKPY
ncbi:MAG: Gx transporter family protein [Eubacterium sp.]|nr:Gx transporter family protein [Eubacterium sp.]